jgi:hypothetical protein
VGSLKTIGKKLAKKAISFAVKATPLGAAVSAAAALVPRGAPRQTPFNQPGIQLPGGISFDLPFSGRAGAGFMRTGGKGRVQPVEGQCPKGFHLNKHRSFDGLPARSFCTRNRRVNFANGRAAGRAGRRLRGTVKLLKKSFTLVTAKPPKGKFIVKRKGR